MYVYVYASYISLSLYSSFERSFNNTGSEHCNNITPTFVYVMLGSIVIVFPSRVYVYPVDVV